MDNKKIPIEKVGTIKCGEIYLKAEFDHAANDAFSVTYQGVSFIVAAKCDVVKDEYDWFKILRAWSENS